MATVTAPAITGIHHLSFTVTNIEDSLSWYKRVFGAEQVDYKFNHLYREETGYGILLVLQPSGLVLAMHHNTGNQHEGFQEARTGMDHVSLQVGARGDLEGWMSRLDELGIAHTPIRDETEPFRYSTVVFRDPDNIQLELIAVG